MADTLYARYRCFAGNSAQVQVVGLQHLARIRYVWQSTNQKKPKLQSREYIHNCTCSSTTSDAQAKTIQEAMQSMQGNGATASKALKQHSFDVHQCMLLLRRRFHLSNLNNYERETKSGNEFCYRTLVLLSTSFVRRIQCYRKRTMSLHCDSSVCTSRLYATDSMQLQIETASLNWSLGYLTSRQLGRSRIRLYFCP